MVIFNLRTQTDLPPTTINGKDVDTVETFRQISPIINTRLSYGADIEKFGVRLLVEMSHIKRFAVTKVSLIHAYHANILSVAKVYGPDRLL